MLASGLSSNAPTTRYSVMELLGRKGHPVTRGDAHDAQELGGLRDRKETAADAPDAHLQPRQSRPDTGAIGAANVWMLRQDCHRLVLSWLAL